MGRYVTEPWKKGTVRDVYLGLGKFVVNEILKNPAGHGFFEWKGHGLYRIDWRPAHRVEIDADVGGDW